MGKKRILALLLALLTLLSATGALAAAKLNAPGTFPVATEKASLIVFAPVSDGSKFDWNTSYMTKWYEEKTNVAVTWKTAPAAAFIEKLNLALASEEAMDLIVAGGSSNTAITTTMQAKYADQELILPIGQYIDNNTQYMKAALDSIEGWRQAITTPDGNIYAVPWYNQCYHCMYYGKMFINHKFLENVGLEIPTTPDEFYEMLVAFRDQDANGNGDPSDEIPMTGATDNYGCKVDTFLMSAFVYDDGEDRLFVNDEGKVQASYMQPEFKEGLKYLSKLYAENLIYPDSFTQTRAQRNEINSRSFESVFGAMPNIHHGIGTRDTKAGEPQRFTEYTAIAPLIGPNGLQITRVNYYDRFALNNAAGLVPATCADPELVFQWLDLLFTPEGIIMQDLGEKGYTWDDADAGSLGVDGQPAVYKSLTVPETDPYYQNFSWGQTFPEFMTAEHRLGRQQPGGMWAEDGSGVEAYLYYMSNTNYEPYGIDISHVVPPLYFSESDAAEMAVLRTDINTFVEESIAKFIVGQTDIETGWDAFQAELQKMNVQRYLEVIQNTYSASAFAK